MEQIEQVRPQEELCVLQWTSLDGKIMHGSGPVTTGMGITVRIAPCKSCGKKLTTISTGQEIKPFLARDLSEVDHYLAKNAQH